MARSSVIGTHLVYVISIALGLHIVAMDEPQRGRVDAIAQSAAVARPVGKYVPEMAVAVRRAHLVRAAPCEVSRSSLMLSGSMGLVKLGQPHPIRTCQKMRTAAHPTHRRRCQVPCYPGIPRFQETPSRFAA